ncbi:MAG: ABC transporter ATP-binding protein, partial [Thermoplasmata archaeon]|nr:ABC transporter ATP-binding protein [Thermoplasmata archaeon]
MIIEADGLTKRYGSVLALNRLTTRIPEGPVGRLGPKGAGKTTFLRLLLGLLRPTTGQGRVLGFDIRSRPLAVRERIGYMPEHDCLIPDMTGIGLVAYMGRVTGLDPNVALGRAHDMLDFVGVGEERYRKIDQYSMGMKQRVKLAQALVHDPDLFLFDEPTAGLDPKGRNEMLKLLKLVSKMPEKSLLISSHLLPDVEDICRHVVILEGGQVVAEGDLQELLVRDMNALHVRVEGDRERFAEALQQAGLEVTLEDELLRVVKAEGAEDLIFRTAHAQGAQIRHLGVEARSLEEV